MAFDEARATVTSMLKGIDRYNPENLGKLERYVEIQATENRYDLEANLAVLKLYQLNPGTFKVSTAATVLLKALTNLPHTDFILCKCLIDEIHQQEPPLVTIMYLANLLETCEFKSFWSECDGATSTLFAGITGFKDSIRKYICHILRITYQTIDRQQLGDLLGYLSDQELNQWMNKYGWKPLDGNRVFISQQEESIKTKNITEKISFESVASVMKLSQ
ncbi:eukaryotic translation initiation factor 3 subunit K-like [Asterias rubens]|uniref:eukaryotic translation initiation factor 3 subunit K-like n=1 Tax=Asterias rubens TaxID=7604 RepID=UPI0014553565|nr:eukaryotic translation initiation factor 3 subunit K-like [Asterias rubens]